MYRWLYTYITICTRTNAYIHLRIHLDIWTYTRRLVVSKATKGYTCLSQVLYHHNLNMFRKSLEMWWIKLWFFVAHQPFHWFILEHAPRGQKCHPKFGVRASRCLTELWELPLIPSVLTRVSCHFGIFTQVVLQECHTKSVVQEWTCAQSALCVCVLRFVLDACRRTPNSYRTGAASTQRRAGHIFN